MIRRIQRSVVSIPSNIAFCSGSLSELETQLTSHRLEYISGELLETYLKEILEFKNMNIDLIRYLSRQ